MVITIIAILASVSVPVFSSVQRKAKLNKSLQHARQVGIALRVYAGDEGGLYPSQDVSSSNDAFRELVDEIGSEKIFYVAGCRYHGTGKFASGPDNRWEESTPPGIALEAGENHYSYAKGYSDSTSARFALIASGFAGGGTEAVYTDELLQPGGVWEGKNCVVIWCDGSGEQKKIRKKDNFKLVDSDGQDLLNPDGSTEWTSPEAG